MSTMHKNTREVEAALKAKGIEFVGIVGGTTGKGHSELHVRRLGVSAKCYVGLQHLTSRHLKNIVRDARNALKGRGAVFTVEEQVEDEEPTPAPPPPVKAKAHRTVLTQRERADFYMLVKSGEEYSQACDAFRISTQTGGRILADGERGAFDKIVSPEYASKKTNGHAVGEAFQADTHAATVGAGAVAAAAAHQHFTATVTAKPEALAERIADGPLSRTAELQFTLVEQQPSPKPRLSPLDPRLPKFIAEHDLLQGHIAEFKRLAEELGIVVRADVEVEWA